MAEKSGGKGKMKPKRTDCPHFQGNYCTRRTGNHSVHISTCPFQDISKCRKYAEWEQETELYAELNPEPQTPQFTQKQGKFARYLGILKLGRGKGKGDKSTTTKSGGNITPKQEDR